MANEVQESTTLSIRVGDNSERAEIGQWLKRKGSCKMLKYLSEDGVERLLSQPQ